MALKYPAPSPPQFDLGPSLRAPPLPRAWRLTQNPFTLPTGTSNASNGHNVSFNWVLHIIGPEILMPLVFWREDSQCLFRTQLSPTYGGTPRLHIRGHKDNASPLGAAMTLCLCFGLSIVSGEVAPNIRGSISTAFYHVSGVLRDHNFCTSQTWHPQKPLLGLPKGCDIQSFASSARIPAVGLDNAWLILAIHAALVAVAPAKKLAQCILSAATSLHSPQSGASRPVHDKRASGWEPERLEDAAAEMFVCQASPYFPLKCHP